MSSLEDAGGHRVDPAGASRHRVDPADTDPPGAVAAPVVAAGVVAAGVAAGAGPAGGGTGEEFDGGTGEEFDQHRAHLLAVAYRVLGSRTDAEDAVQEAWLRLDRADRAAIVDLRGWLTTVVARLCLDELRSARARREAYVGPWLPEPVVQALPGRPEGAGPGGALAGAGGAAAAGLADPGELAAEDDSVRLAMLVVLDRLAPEQRVALVLHDVFGVPFDQVAGVLGRSPAAARQLASRARRTVAGAAPPPRASLAEQRQVLDAFVAACRGGDLAGLVRLLDPSVVLTADGGGVGRAARRPVRGADDVARFLLGLVRQAAGAAVLEPALVNGELGLVAGLVGLPAPVSVLGLTVSAGRVTALWSVVNPSKLTRVPWSPRPVPPSGPPTGRPPAPPW